MVSKALVATLGFDERHVVKSLIDIGMSNVVYIILLVPNWGLDERSRKAISMITNIAGLAGIEESRVIVYEVDVLDFFDSIREILDMFNELYLRGVDEFILSLGGGLRILVIEAYTAALMAPKHISEKIVVRIGIEGRVEHVSFNIKNLPLCLQISEHELTILEKLKKQITSISELSRETNTPRSTIWKTLQKLYQKNLVNKLGSRYVITELGKALLKTKASTQKKQPKTPQTNN